MADGVEVARCAGSAASRSVEAVRGAPARWLVKRRAVIGVLALFVACLTGAVAPVSASASLTWGSPVLVDAAPPLMNSSFSPAGLSCPSAALCVAADRAGGNAISWSNPAEGQTAWRAARVNFTCPDPNSGYCDAGGDGLTAVSCPTATLCVAGGPVDRLFDSVNPLAGIWSPISLAGPALHSFGAVDGVACASASLCIAVDSAGNVLSSGGPSGAWTAAAVDPQPLRAVACASVSLCVAVDAVGDVLTSTDPGGGASAWTTAPIDPGHPLTGVSCASTDLCVAVDGAGTVLSSTSPTGGGSAWSASPIDPGAAFSGVSCPAVSLCVAVDPAGDAASSTDPTGPTGAWNVTRLSRAVARTATATAASVSCPSISQCVVIDDLGDAWISTDPTAAAPTWTATQIGRYNDMVTIACPSVSLCLAGDDAGNIVSSTAPSGGPSAWTFSRVEPRHTIASVACTSPSVCVAADDTGALLTSNDPTGGKGAWTRWPISRSQLTVHCTTAAHSRALARRRSGAATALCLAFNAGGRMFASSTPQKPGSAWTRLGRPVRGLADVSCPSPSLCIALTAADSLLSSRDPAVPGARWAVHRSPQFSSEDGQTSGRAISCASARLCVGTFDASDGKYDWPVVAVADPRARRVTWRIIATGGGPGDSGGSAYPAVCTSASRCFALGIPGMITSTRPADGPRAWTTVRLPVSPTAVACPSATLCVALDARGEVLTAH